jgi:hypothetical protein
MVANNDEQTTTQVEARQGRDGNGDEHKASPGEYPYLGRSVRVVGPWESVDATNTPHEKNKRGELEIPCSTGISTGPRRTRWPVSPFPNLLPTGVIPCRMR